MNDDDTESASDFDAVDYENPDKVQKTSEKNLSSHMTMQEIAGKVPESMLINIDYNKFVVDGCGWEKVQQNQ